MLLPYNVDRITKKVPWVTYSLMGINVFIFLMSILVSNFSLPADREEGLRQITALTQNAPLPDFQGGFESEEEVGENRLQIARRFQLSPTDEAPLQEAPGQLDANQFTTKQLSRLRQIQALIIASKKLETPDDTKRLYVISHAYDHFTDEPHYSILNSFAYRPNDPSFLQRTFAIFTAMFLHSSLDHLLGNMLFLWIFGRAVEEFLGRKFFLSTYLLSGIGATFLQHNVTAIFTPSAMGVPNLGASGAIAGVLGLFAVRFYRTKVRIFYLFGWGIWAFVIIFAIVSGIIEAIIQQPLIAALMGLGVAGVTMYFVGRGNSWGAFRLPSIWVIGIWVFFLNIVPAVWQLIYAPNGGGVAYWAHLGGFLCGAMYALIIGGVDEGKAEYALEDAQTALQTSGSDEALRHAGALLQKDAKNPAAHEVAAQAYDRRKNLEVAAYHYGHAIEGYWKSGDRDASARLYGIALENHPYLPLRPSLLLSLSNHFSQNKMWNESAGLLTRIVDEFPAVPEAEIALLRAAGLWMKEYDDPAEAARMMEMFRERYPMSEWQSQAQGLERTARQLMAQRGLGS
ncbi:rhomboid family intramembrane serine protease [bacterium]|nr:MAG: rhomboid family intramembrane serine protease [bacterium]